MQALFSDHWHAVRHMRPRLRPGVQPLHRRLRGKPWVLLQDPVTQRFHRVAPAVWRVLLLLDGQRTLDEVWEQACARADAAGMADSEVISQHELVQLMGALYANDLLQTQVPPDAVEVFQRHEKQQRAQFKQRWLNPMSLKLPLLHPDAWFERQAGLARALFTVPVLLLWLAFVLPAAVLAVQHWAQLTDNLSDRVLSAGNLLMLACTYPLVKAVHEWAHGLAVKAWGGAVREIGIMFIVFMPVPYVDATASYAFASKWQRAAVAAAGIAAELLIGAAAVYLWLLAEPGWVRAVAFNVFLITGVSTVLVNGNPLMRYDGYFIACDLLEMPNLGQRANAAWVWVLDRFGFGACDATPPLEARGEWPLLLAYGAVAPVYRLLITLGLIWFVASEYLLLGAVMALMAAWAALVMPLWKGWKHLRESPGLARRRGTALGRTALALGGLAGFVALVPVPFHSVHQGVVWLPDEAIVRAEVDGQVLRPLLAAGAAVAAGQPVVLVDNPQVDAELAVAEADLAHTQAQLRQAEVEAPAQAPALRAALQGRQARLAEAQRRAEALVVKAGTAGVWTPVAPTELAGRAVRRGEVLGHVAAAPSRLVRTAVSQDDMDLVSGRGEAVQVRLAQAPRVVLAGRVQRPVAGAEHTLVSAALGTGGGGSLAVDPAKPGGTHSLQRVVDLEVQLAQPVARTVFGDRAWVRFDLGHAPLGWQWFLRLRQLFLARLSV